jgi:hypothetical protein
LSVSFVGAQRKHCGSEKVIGTVPKLLMTVLPPLAWLTAYR